MRGGHAVVVAVALTALSACGSSQAGANDGGAGAKVASLTGAEPTTSAPSTRPRYRFDMTAEDEKVLWAPYYKCLKELGVSQVDAKIAMDAATKGQLTDSKQAEGILACEQKYLPQVEWEKDPANPKAADFERLVNACLKQKGIKREGTTYAEDNIAEALDATSDCELEVAADMK